MGRWIRPDWRAALLDVFACFIIPTYSLLFTHETQWFHTNFSVIGALEDRKNAFFFWGMLVGIYLMCVLLPIAASLPWAGLSRSCLVLGFLLLLAAVILPYTPDELPKIADLHIICAFAASCLLVLALFLLVLACVKQDRERYWECMKWLGVTVVICGVLFSMTGFITSALELFFVLSVTLLTRRLWRLYRGFAKN